MVTQSQAQAVAARVEKALGERPLKWLADESGIARTTLNRHFKDGNFRVVELIAIADVLDVNASEFLEDLAS